MSAIIARPFVRTLFHEMYEGNKSGDGAASTVFTFNGVDQYATMPDWTPNGLPFSVEVSAVPLTVDTLQYLVSSGTSLQHLSVSGLNNVEYRYRENGNAARIIGVPSQGLGVTDAIDIDADAINASITVAGVTDTDTPAAPSLINALKVIASHSTTAAVDVFHGPIYQLKLTDSSPIQDTTACFGNGARYVELEQPIVLEGDFEIEFDYIYDSTARTVILGELATNTWIDIYGVNDRFTLIVNGGTAQIWVGLGLADGQHFRGKISYLSGLMRCYIDGREIESGKTGITPFSPQRVGATNTGANNLAVNRAFQNIKIKDITNARDWEFNLTPAGGDTDIGNAKFVMKPADLTGAYGYTQALGALTPSSFGLGGANVVEMKADSNDLFTLILDTAPVTTPVAIVFNKIEVLLTEAPVNTWTATVPGSYDSLLKATADGDTSTLYFTEKGLTWTLLDAPNTGVTQGNYLNQPLWDRYTLDGDGARYITIPEFVALDNDVVSLSWSGIYDDTNIYSIWGNKDEGPGRLIANDAGFDLRLWIGGGQVQISDAFTGMSTGDHYRAVVSRPDGITWECSVNGIPATMDSAGRPQGFTINTIMSSLGTSFAPAGVSVGNVILENLTTSEYIEYKIDEGTGTVVKAYDRAGAESPALNGTVTPNASWSLQPEYSNDGQWTPDTDWQDIADNSRIYAMRDSEGATFACRDGNYLLTPANDATIINPDSVGGGWG